MPFAVVSLLYAQRVFFLSSRVMRVYSTHTKKKAFFVSKMSSGPLAEGEVGTFLFNICMSL